MQKTTLSFPQIQLQRRHGHKLRGYFAQQFGKESDLFHNHTEEGKDIYRYPRIQYKVIKGVPTVVGIEEGASLIIERFLNIKHLDIDGKRFQTEQKNMKNETFTTGVNGDLYEYQFLNPWMALNQENHKKYVQMSTSEKKIKLQKILINNIISFFKSVKHNEKKDIKVKLQLKDSRTTRFKNQNILTFSGGFVTNVKLPDYIGLGKSVSRGFGAIGRV